MKNNYFTYRVFVGILLIALIDYDIFPVLMVFYLLFLIFKKEEISLLGYQKRVIKFFVFNFLIFLRFFPIFQNKYFYFWNNIFQQNYLFGDGKFYAENIFFDLQLFFISLGCNDTLSFNKSPYILRYSGYYLEDSKYQCPYKIPYGEVLNNLNISYEFIWQATLIVAFLSLIIFYIVYLDLVANRSSRDFLVVTTIFLSPPINFLTARLNIDLIIFIFLYFAFKYLKNSNLLNILIFFISLLKFYPAILIFADMLLKLLKRDYKRLFTPFILSILSIYYFFIFDSNYDSVSFFAKTTESHRAFGVLNDILYITKLFNLNILFVTIVLVGLIFYFINLDLINKNFYFDNEQIKIIIMFFFISFFVNYDYRLIVLLLLLKNYSIFQNKIFLSSYLIFIYSSPTLLHTYTKYYILTLQDEFYFFDFSFYLFLVICFRIMINSLKNIKKVNS